MAKLSFAVKVISDFHDDIIGEINDFESVAIVHLEIISSVSVK